MELPGWFPDDVSRETLERLDAFADLAARWSAKINLVSKRDLPFIRDRHIWDSLQICTKEHLSYGPTWLDLGSGGGFPGLVVAIMAKEMAPGLKVTLVESDQRKGAFLRTAVQTFHLNAAVDVKRIEALRVLPPATISARALADLPKLLSLSSEFTEANTKFLLPKGESWKEEIELARKHWHFDVTAEASHTNNKAAILELRHVRRI